VPILIDIALWGALGLTALVVAISGYLLVTRSLRGVASRYLARRYTRARTIIEAHAAGGFSSIDRLLFELGTIQDDRAVERALNTLLESGAEHLRPKLAKIYEALGLIERYRLALRGSKSWGARATAAKALGELEVVEAISALVEAMRDPHEDRSVRLAAGQALARMKAEAAIPQLIAELGQADDWASPRLADALVEFGDRAQGPLLTALADEGQDSARVWAAQILGRIGATAALPQLMACLQDRSERVRIAVTEALGLLADRRATPDLLRLALNDPVPAVRAEAARALGGIGDSSVIDELLQLLSASDYWTRLRAVEAIEKLKPDDTYALERALTDDSRVVRAEAARALERLGVLAQWKAKLDDRDAEVSGAAMEKLIQFGKTGSVESLLSCAEHTSLRIRSRICTVLADIGNAYAIPCLERLLNDPEWPVRAQAAEAIGQIRPGNAAELLLPLLDDVEEMVRVAAINAIRQIDTPNLKEHVAELAALYRRGNTEARCSVIDAIKYIPSEDVSALLMEGMDDPDVDVRLHAVRHVSGRACGLFTDLLTQRLSDADSDVRKAAARALGMIDSPAALHAMLESLSTPDREFREILTDALAKQGVETILRVAGNSRVVEKRLALAWALGKTRDPQSLEELSRLAEDPASEVRAAVAGAVSKVGGSQADRILRRLLEDPNERVRSAAVNGFGHLGTSARIPELSRLLEDPHGFVRNRLAITLGLLGGDEASAGLDRLIERASDAESRAHVVVALGLLGSERGRRLALEALADDRQRPDIEQVLATEEPAHVERFRKNLLLGDADLDTHLSAESLRRYYMDQLRNSRDGDLRLEALTSLSSLGPVQEVDTLIDVISSDPSPEVRRLAVESLSPHLLEERVTETLRRALHDPIAEVQRAAIDGLAQSGDPRHNEALMRCSALSDLSVADAIERALACANEGRVPEFLDELMGFADEPVLAVGARVLGHIGDSRAQRLLSTWARSGESAVRTAAIGSLGTLGTVEAKETLTGCLGDPHEDIRSAAAVALTKLPLRGVIAKLKTLTKDPSVVVRAHLASQLSSSGDVGAIELAHELAGDPDERVRTEALASLVRHGSDVSVERFIELFQDQPREIKQAVRGRAESPELLQPISELATTHRRAATRALAVKAIGQLGVKPEALLRSALADPAATVRIVAVEVCGALGDPALDEAVLQLLKDPVARVRAAVRKTRLKVVEACTAAGDR